MINWVLLNKAQLPLHQLAKFGCPWGSQMTDKDSTKDTFKNSVVSKIFGNLVATFKDIQVVHVKPWYRFIFSEFQTAIYQTKQPLFVR